MDGALCNVSWQGVSRAVMMMMGLRQQVSTQDAMRYHHIIRLPKGFHGLHFSSSTRGNLI